MFNDLNSDEEQKDNGEGVNKRKEKGHNKE